MPVLALTGLAAATFWGGAAAGGATLAAGAMSNRAQGKSADRALNYQQTADTTAMDWEREQETQRRAETDRVAEEDKRRWDAEEANRKVTAEQTAKQLEIAETERLRKAEYDRWSQDRQAKLDAMSAEDRRIALQREAEREARMAPYREASKAALGRLQGIITAPGAGTSPAAHQFSRPTTLRDVMPRN